MANLRRRGAVAIRTWFADLMGAGRARPSAEFGLGALVVFSTFFAAACFNPKATSGGLTCSNDPAHLCPAGYSCHAEHCYKNGDPLTPTGGSGGASGGGGGGTGGAATGGQAGGCATRTPLCNDVPASGEVCQPTCQTGACGCSSQCSVGSNGMATCAPIGTKNVGDLCHMAPDDCGPGLVCQAEACGAGLARCYRFCRDFGDCGGSVPCTKTVRTAAGEATNYMACDVAPSACDPIAQTGCGDSALVCYVVGPTSTRCDCLGANLPEGQPCTSSTACAPGLECVGAGAGDVSCQRLCRTSADCVRPDGGAAGSCIPSGNFATCFR